MAFSGFPQDPLQALLRRAPDNTPQTTSNVMPPVVPNNFPAIASIDEQGPYRKLTDIANILAANRDRHDAEAAAEAEKQREAALLRKIQAMIPQPSYGGGGGGYTGGGGGGYSNPSGSIYGNPGGGHSGGGSILPDIGGHDLTGGVHLPNVYGHGPDYSHGNGSPVTAPPRGGCTPHMIELGLCG